MLYFGFAIADSMFPAKCGVRRTPMTAEEVRHLLSTEVYTSVLNPSHLPTIRAAARIVGEVAVPAQAPQVALTGGDRVVVMSVRGLPRLGGDRHEYTEAEVASATFAFGVWEVID